MKLMEPVGIDLSLERAKRVAYERRTSCHSQIDWFEDLLVDKTFHLILDLNVMIYFISI